MDVVKISSGNSKLGGIWNLSLPPIATCRKDAPCVKDCYAMKPYRRFTNVRIAWMHNLTLWEKAPDQFEASLIVALSQITRPRFFRWHTAGDIPTQGYLAMMFRVATACPDINFLAFTKRYEFINNCPDTTPENITIVFSAWPGLKMDNPYEFQVAWMQDGTEDRVPESAIECPGHCDECGMCWALDKINKDVVFHKH